VLVFLPAWPRGSRPFAGVPTVWRWALVAAGALLGAHFLTWIASLGMTSVASSVVLVSTHPLWVAAGGAVLWGERVSRRAAAGIATALAGTAVLAVGDGLGGGSLTGDLLALLGAATFAGYLLVGRRLRSRVAVLPYATVVYAVAALALLPAVALLHAPLWPYPLRQWALFAALAVVPTIGGHTVFNWSLGYLPATAVSLALLVEPVGASLLAWGLLGQPPSAADVAGGILVLAGIALYAPAQPRST
jgi:drug/metabolite transporter (DMT)-like permease